jgi:pimeloyl-ACP methyl ester carboxylesterase
MPERVASIATVSGMGPLDTPEAEARLTREQRFRRFVTAWLSPIVRFRTWQATRSIRRDVGSFLMERAEAAPVEDQMQLERPAINSMMRQDLIASVAQGGGTIAHEMGLMARPWQFDLSQVRAPMQIWHGTHDDVVPLWLAESVASRLPHAETRFLSDLGHLLLLSHMTDIIVQLLESRTEPDLAETAEPDAAATAAD